MLSFCARRAICCTKGWKPLLSLGSFVVEQKGDLAKLTRAIGPVFRSSGRVLLQECAAWYHWRWRSKCYLSRCVRRQKKSKRKRLTPSFRKGLFDFPATASFQTSNVSALTKNRLFARGYMQDAYGISRRTNRCHPILAQPFVIKQFSIASSLKSCRSHIGCA